MTKAIEKSQLERWHELAKLSKAAYAGPIRHSIYTYNKSPLQGQKIVHGSFGRGYCRIFWNDCSTIIAFRGTRESVDWIISNAKMFPVQIRDCENAHNVKVHRGFQRTLDFGDKTTELRSLDAIFNYLEDFELLNKQIAITGHSLGGALATLFATKFRSRWTELCDANLSEVVTFGAPAVGLQSFKSFYGDLAKKTFRIINKADGVPFTPPVFYRHVGQEIWLNDKSVASNVGWPTRLRLALQSPLALSSDHSMTEYVVRLKRELSTHNNS